MSDDTPHEGGHCYFCGGEAAEGGTIQVQMNEDEPLRECCPECIRNWPPEGVEV